MKLSIITGAALCMACAAYGQDLSVKSPDNALEVKLNLTEGKPTYEVYYKGQTFLEKSPLGLHTNIGDLSKGLTLVSSKTGKTERTYTNSRIKRLVNHYEANSLTCTLANAKGQKFDVVFQVSNHNIAFKYHIPTQKDTQRIIIEKEATGFDFPSVTTTFLCPQASPMIGWAHTKPSYEEEYNPDQTMGVPSKYGYGYTFPGLFHVGKQGWVLVSETGLTGKYCASHLSEGTKEGLYTVAFPDPKENNGNGSAFAGLSLPGDTPWRTLTVGETLKPIVETTIPFDVVSPLYKTTHTYKSGRGTWSWIMWQDGSCNYEDQVKYIDLAHALGYEYILIDAWWDERIGRDRMKELIQYAKTKGVEVFLWYNSNGYWNDAPQSPRNCMDNSVARHKEMQWMKDVGIKGIKVDFFGGDKQETIHLYEDILADANQYGIGVIFHGCTLPRGWEEMYPNYISSEAVLASENLIFSQHYNDQEAFNASLHPFIRNAVGAMDFGPVLLNKRHNRTNDGGTRRITTDIFQLATGVLFQSSTPFFGLAPNNLKDVPSFEMDFMRQLPSTWEDTRFIDGYPGKYVVLARKHGNQWYVTGVNAQQSPAKVKVSMPELAGKTVTVYTDDKKGQPQMKQTRFSSKGESTIVIQPNGGTVLVNR